MKNYVTSYGDSKPILIGEFDASNGIRDTGVQMYNQLYNMGYAGALGWCIEDATLAA